MSDAAPSSPTLTFVGTGEACDPQLPNTSLLYRGGRVVLIDCGYSVPAALWRVTTDVNLIDAIYISHLHADHSFGLPGLLLWMREGGRERALTIIGGPGLEPWLERLLDLGYPGSFTKSRAFPIEPLVADGGEPTPFGPLTLRTAPSDHSVRNLALRIEERGGSCCYSGDGAPTPETRALYRDADLLVHECWAAGPGINSHAHVEQVLELAQEARIARLCLLHIGRDSRAPVAARVAQETAGRPVLIPAPGDVVGLARA